MLAWRLSISALLGPKRAWRSLAAFCPSLVLAIALWILITPILPGFCAWADKARQSPRAGKTKPAFFTTKLLQESARAIDPAYKRSEERRVGKECRSRWSTYR